MASQITATISPLVHHAPAGKHYHSIKEAGRTLLDINFGGFLEGKSHATIPPIYVNKNPEEVGDDGLIVPGPGFNKDDLKGADHEKLGEDLEIKVFQQFEKILGKPIDACGFAIPELLWVSFDIIKYKVAALLSEYPGLAAAMDKFRKRYTSKAATTFGEADMLFLIKDIGIIAVEIKRSINKKMAGYKQCKRISDFASLVFDGCAPNNYPLPVVKVVVVGELQTGN